MWSSAQLAACVSLLLTGCGLSPCDVSVVLAAREQMTAILETAPTLSEDTDAGLVALADWEALPTFGSAAYQQFASHKRRPGTSLIEPGGKDFNNFIAHSGPAQLLLLEELDGPDETGGQLDGYVLAAADDGPGYVSRMFFTRFELGDAFLGRLFFNNPERLGRFENEVLRIYVDDLTTPAFVIPLRDIGQVAPFVSPLAGRNSAALVSYLPISFNERLRIVLDGLCPLNGYFYHVNVQQIDAPTRPFSPRLNDDPLFADAQVMMQSLGANPNDGFEAAVMDARFTIQPDETAVLYTDDAAGTIGLLRLTFDAITPLELHATKLQVYYDGAEGPAIDVPLDAFFGCREGIASFSTLPMVVVRDGDALELNCHLPMPYAEQIVVRLRNTGNVAVEPRVTIGVDRALPAEPWGYLHAATFSVAGAQPAGSRFQVLKVTGRGRYVGTFLYVAGNTDLRPGEIGSSLNILEGNELGIIDGEPRILGTGTEDYYNGGFYFATGRFDHPFGAANVVPDDYYRDPGVVSCCRWHILSDAIDFRESFELSFQYGSDYPSLVVRYATMAYYYLDRPAPGMVTGGNILSE